MSLLERIKANPLPFAELLGVEFVSAAPDAVEARMIVRPDLCTLGGFAHGGAMMSFADTLGGAPAMKFVLLSSVVVPLASAGRLAKAAGPRCGKRGSRPSRES